jgi:hypothetical protein
MPTRKEILAECRTRWMTVRNAGLAQPMLTQDVYTIGDLARRFNLPWYRPRDEIWASEYLALEYKKLMRLRGFGLGKLLRLLAIFEAALGGDIQPTVATSPLAQPKKTREALQDWRIPDSFPVGLMRLSARIINFCESSRIETLGGLLDTIESLGEPGLLKQDNLGRKSVGEMVALLNALRSGDASAVRHCLPLANDGLGLSLAIAVKYMIEDLSPRQRPLMERRLVQKMTLEEAAADAGLTRERVRQVARDFLIGPLHRLLNWFPSEQQTLLQLWLEGGDLLQKLGPFSTPADEALAVGAITAVFEEEPEAVAANLNQEQQFELWYDQLRNSAEFQKTGVDLQSFLDRTVPARQQTAFTDFLFQKPVLSIDHESGRIRPERRSLRRLVHALLREEDDPVPATWLVRLVQESDFYRDQTVPKLLRNYRGWIQRHPDFPRDRILWNE